jgi:hypothetical protein
VTLNTRLKSHFQHNTADDTNELSGHAIGDSTSKIQHQWRIGDLWWPKGFSALQRDIWCLTDDIFSRAERKSKEIPLCCSFTIRTREWHPCGTRSLLFYWIQGWKLHLQIYWRAHAFCRNWGIANAKLLALHHFWLGSSSCSFWMYLPKSSGQV